MPLTLELPPETEKKLHERAAEAGQSVERVAVQLIEETLAANGGTAPSHSGKTFDEILAPTRRGWEESGLSDDQVDQLFDDTLRKIRDEKREKAAMNQMERPGAVFDCDVFFQATRNANGPAAKAFRLLETGAFSLL